MSAQNTPVVDSKVDLRRAAGEQARELDALTKRIENWIKLAEFVGLTDFSEAHDLIAANEEHALTLRRYAHGGKDD